MLLTSEHPAGTEITREVNGRRMWATYTGRTRMHKGWQQFQVENEHGLFWLAWARLI